MADATKPTLEEMENEVAAIKKAEFESQIAKFQTGYQQLIQDTGVEMKAVIRFNVEDGKPYIVTGFLPATK